MALSSRISGELASLLQQWESLKVEEDARQKLVEVISSSLSYRLPRELTISPSAGVVLSCTWPIYPERYASTGG